MLDVSPDYDAVLVYIGACTHRLDPDDAIEIGNKIMCLGRDIKLAQYLRAAPVTTIDPNQDFMGL